MILCSIFNPNPVFTSVTVSNLTPTRIPYAGTAGLLADSANLTFDGTNLTCSGSAAFCGAAINAVQGISSTKTGNTATLIGAALGVVNTRNSVATGTYTYGISFTSYWDAILGATANRAITSIFGGYGQVGITLDAAEPYNKTGIGVSVYRSQLRLTSAISPATGVAIMTTAANFWAVTPSMNTGSIITTGYAFYDAGQYIDGTKTPNAWGLGINTPNNYINGSLSIGKVTAPTVPLDVVGAILNTTTIEAGTNFRCGGTAAIADGTYTVGARLTPVTGIDGTITTKGGIVTAIQPAT